MCPGLVSSASLSYGVIHEQTDNGQEGSLGCVLANIIMTELEKVVVDYLINNGTMKFYARYVDVTLLMMKPKDVKIILK